MKKILIATHGKTAEGVVNTLEILTGVKKNIFSINAYVDDNLLQDEIKQFIDQVEENDTVLIFTDMSGGSVNQAFVEVSNEKNIFLITGFNIPLILELVLESREITIELIDEKINLCKQQMFRVEIDKVEKYMDDEEDFFGGEL